MFVFFKFIETSNFLPICNIRCLISFVALIKWIVSTKEEKFLGEMLS